MIQRLVEFDLFAKVHVVTDAEDDRRSVDKAVNIAMKKINDALDADDLRLDRDNMDLDQTVVSEIDLQWRQCRKWEEPERVAEG